MQPHITREQERVLVEKYLLPAITKAYADGWDVEIVKNAPNEVKTLERPTALIFCGATVKEIRTEHDLLLLGYGAVADTLEFRGKQGMMIWFRGKVEIRQLKVRGKPDQKANWHEKVLPGVPNIYSSLSGTGTWTVGKGALTVCKELAPKTKIECKDGGQLAVVNACCVCFEPRQLLRYKSCQHALVCRACSARVQLCPVCRAPIET